MTAGIANLGAVEHAEGDGQGDGRVVDADLHRCRDCLRCTQLQQTGAEVAESEADQAEESGGQADLLEVVDEVLPLAEQGADGDHDEDDDREDPHRSVRPLREAAGVTTYHHAESNRDQHDDHHLDQFAQLQAQLSVGVEVAEGQVGDHGDGECREHRVDCCEGDVERHITAEEMAEKVRSGATGRSRQQHQPDRQARIDIEPDDQTEGNQRQDEDLQDESDAGSLRGSDDSAEVVDCQREAEAEHDDGQGNGQADRDERRIIH